MAIPRRVRKQLTEFLEEKATSVDANVGSVGIGANNERSIEYDSELDTLVVVE